MFGKLKGVFDSGSRRSLLVIVVVFGLGAVLYFWKTSGTPTNTSNMRPIPQQGQTTQGGQPVSPTYKQALTEDDTRRAEEARKLGASSVPTIVMTPATTAAPPNPGGQAARLPGDMPPRQEPVVVGPRPLTVAQMPPPPPAVRPNNDQQSQALARTIGQMGDDKLPGAEVKYWIDTAKTATTASVGASGQTPQILQENANQASQSANSALKPPAGTVLYAEMLSEANSDAPGPVIARIQQGPLAGSTLIGKFQVAQDALVIQFNKMTVISNASGHQTVKTVDIDSYAVDTDKLGTALATDVDRHLFDKIAVTAATSFVQGMGQAVAQSGATVTQTAGVGTQVAYPSLDTKQQLLVAGGQTAGQIGQILQKEFGDKKTTIKVRTGTPIGVLFL
jgi:intracellular multiplication protein IcmE